MSDQPSYLEAVDRLNTTAELLLGLLGGGWDIPTLLRPPPNTSATCRLLSRVSSDELRVDVDATDKALVLLVRSSSGAIFRRLVVPFDGRPIESPL